MRTPGSYRDDPTGEDRQCFEQTPGTTHLLCGIGHHLLSTGGKARYTTSTLPAQELLIAKRDPALSRLLRRVNQAADLADLEKLLFD